MLSDAKEEVRVSLLCEAGLAKMDDAAGLYVFCSNLINATTAYIRWGRGRGRRT